MLGSGAASAADLPARLYTKAPVMPPSFSWTGFYVSGGGGYGMWDGNNTTVVAPGFPGAGSAVTSTQRMGGDGFFGTFGAGYDWQFSSSWVGGIFGDVQFGSIRGTVQDAALGVSGSEKDRTNWAAGLRLGYLVTPSVLTYVNGGYSGAEFSGATLSDDFGTGPFSTTTSFHRDGWFVGGGVENQIGVLGFGPGWFMKTEYRAAEYNRVTLPESFVAGGLPIGLAVTLKPLVQTVSTQLVYRFNWSGVSFGP
jgi:outer membrane immunogenic protein